MGSLRTVASALGLLAAYLVTPAGTCALAAPNLTVPADMGHDLVVAFEGAGDDPRLVWLGEGVATLVADGLRRAGRPTYSGRERARILEGMQLPTGARLSYATVVRVAEVVGAASLVTGTIELDQERLIVRTRSLDVDSGRAEPEIVERGPVSDLFAITERVVRRLVGRAVEPSITQSSGPDAPPPLDAFESYIKGLIAESPETRAKFLEATLKRHPGYARAQIALWDVYTEQQDHERALETATAVPGHSRLARHARFLAARSLISLSRYDDAIGALKDLLGAQPTAALYNDLGIVQVRRETPPPETETPTAYFSKAAKLQPENADFFFNLGYAFWLERDMQAAIYWLREVVRRNPADGDAHYVLAAALDESGRATEAARERELARQLSSTYVQWERQASGGTGNPVPGGLERLSEGLDDVPTRLLDSVVVQASQEEHAELARFHRDRGRRFYEQQHNREALAELRKALYLEPYEASTHLWLGRALTQAGRLREAIDSLKISIWSRDSAAARIALATVLVESGDSGGAREHVERALQLDPTSEEGAVLRARMNRAK
ncbi:MAG: tetratricopeptide repeat protein [Luteitalea sp.]|nr:tetratricopeptide repeat protein [Luteitalea sp.]